MRVHVRPGGPGTLNSDSIIRAMSISLANFFFKRILSRKNWKGGDELLLLKNVQ